MGAVGVCSESILMSLTISNTVSPLVEENAHAGAAVFTFGW